MEDDNKQIIIYALYYHIFDIIRICICVYNNMCIYTMTCSFICSWPTRSSLMPGHIDMVPDDVSRTLMWCCTALPLPREALAGHGDAPDVDIHQRTSRSTAPEIYIHI